MSFDTFRRRHKNCLRGSNGGNAGPKHGTDGSGQTA